MEEKKLPPLPKNSQPAFPASTSAQKGKKAGKREWYSSNLNLGGGFWQQLSRVFKLPWQVYVLIFAALCGAYPIYSVVETEILDEIKSKREWEKSRLEHERRFGTSYRDYRSPEAKQRELERKQLEELKGLRREVKSLNDKLEGK